MDAPGSGRCAASSAPTGCRPGTGGSSSGLAGEQRRLRQQVLLLRPFQRLFRYWHVFHLPLAIVMFLILAVHVGVAVLFGYTWVF